MSTVTETNPRPLALTEAGVSGWHDQIRRSLVESGELAWMIAEDCLRGMTANPSILELIDDPARDLEVPGAGYSFGALIAAQAAGDLLTLRAHRLPAERVRLERAPPPAVRALSERIAALLAGA
jgi:hypothetical protein